MAARTPQETQAVSAKALGYLARREHSAHELKIKLKNHHLSPEAIDDAIASLQARGLQCDLRYSAMIIRHRSSKGYGPGWISAALKAHGISAYTVQKAFEDESVNFDEVKTTWATKLKAQGKTKSQIYLALHRRGFYDI